MSVRAKVDLIAAGQECRALLQEHGTIGEDAESLATWHNLSRVLFALWDLGFYDFVKASPSFTIDRAVSELELDREVFEVCLKYLVGHRMFSRQPDGCYALTARGSRLHNVLARGYLDLYVGAYSPFTVNLPALLKGTTRLADVHRSTKHAALGTEEINCVLTMPFVLGTIVELGGKCVLDLGCGGGGFLRQLAAIAPNLRGIGVDMDGPAIAYARAATAEAGLGGRLRFEVGELGGNLNLEPLKDADVITAMYMLHEFGRDGEAGVIRVLRQITTALPGRRMMFLECEPPDFEGTEQHPNLTILDYWLVHPLSGQGCPMDEHAWRRLVEQAGCKYVRSTKPSPLSLARAYIVET